MQIVDLRFQIENLRCTICNHQSKICNYWFLMIEIRPSNERGGGDYGWLNTRHTFSFDQYHDPRWTGFRSLRVVNDDRVVLPSGIRQCF